MTTRHALLVGVLCGLAACAGGPYTVEVLAEGGQELNPTYDAQPSAVNIRIVQLVDSVAFEGATTEDLLANPPNLAPGTWVPPHQEAIVYVEQKSWIPVEVKKDVRFLGVLALFNDGSGQARAVVPVDVVEDQKLFFDRYSVGLRERESEDYR